jgi:V/A-type H+-transporting ATPase subunit E
MTTIEDKISLFSKIIYDKVNEEKEEKLKILNEEIDKKINIEKVKIDELTRNLQIEATKKFNIIANGIVAKERLNKQREILSLKDKLILGTLGDVREKLVEFVSLPEYKTYLIGTLQNTLKDMNKGRYFIIVIKRDYDKFKSEIEHVIEQYGDLDVEIKISEEDFIGGAILKDLEGKFKIDNSIDSKLQESKEMIGVRVMEMLA